MSLRETLDDAADLALGGRRIDPVAVLTKAVERDAPASRLRRRAPWLLGVAAAVAVLALVAALLPWSSWGRVEPAAPPPLGPTGLPTGLDAPPLWTPLVTEHPIEAASVVFAGDVMHGVSGTGPGLFVLSADGREYRRLPWTGDVTGWQPALSADGRWVAWVNAASDGAGTEPVVHLLRLRDGSRRDLRLPQITAEQELSVGGLVFRSQGGRAAGLLVSGQVMDPTGNVAGRTWRVDLPVPSSGARVACECQEAFGLAADGTVYRSNLAGQAEGLSDLPVLPGAERASLGAGPWPVAVSPDGKAWAKGEGDAILQIGRESGVTSLDQPRLTVPDVLGWGARGVLLKQQVAGPQGVTGAQLAWFDPQRRTTTVIAQIGAWTAERRPVVAAGLVATGVQVPTALPEDVPWWSGDHRTYLAARGLVVAFGLLGVAGILGFPWILRRLRRRDQDVLTTAHAGAGNQGRLW